MVAANLPELAEGSGLAQCYASSFGMPFKQSMIRYQYPFPNTDIAALALVTEPVHVFGKVVRLLEALVSINPVPDPTLHYGIRFALSIPVSQSNKVVLR